jgi:catechol 2,3-dioxygenase-like lactoylglutathione lyase family enzyme
MPGHPPRRWAATIPELLVEDYGRTLDFWTGLLGFEVRFDRPSEQLAMLEHPDGAQIMFFVRDGSWETGRFEPPYGRGVVIQVFVADVDAIAARISAAGHPFFVAPFEKWRDWGDRLGGQREFLVLDPDGYLVKVAQALGERPLPAPAGAGPGA